MQNNRIKQHPILPVEKKEEITFYFEKKPYQAQVGEMISSALYANNIKIFGHHKKDGGAQGIYCANGQCSQCMVIANGKPVKACMTAIKENMFIEKVEGLPRLPEVTEKPIVKNIEEIKTQVLIIGGGPAGLSAAIQLGEHGIDTLLVDDKNKLGGKLVLQTHKFFGSIEDSYAGTRGIEIGKKLAYSVQNNSNITVWTNSIALYVFKDKKVGILKDDVYKLVKPEIILNTAGAREKFLCFPGNTKAGIYGAGAFQTLVNRDLVKPTEKLFIIGGGNVGLIAGYHALQAGIEVIGLAEALPSCGGYKVHEDKLKRLGVPIYTSHTVVSANGGESVESITIAEIDDNFIPIPNTEKTFNCDTILIAVGLESVNEFEEEAKIAGMKVYSAGDAAEIAEASAAMFNGKIAGLQIAKEFKPDLEKIPQSWYEKAKILQAPPGKTKIKPQTEKQPVMPILNCVQEIPCNPCITVCPFNSIVMKDDPILGVPEFSGKCIGCGKCVEICPGLAITLVDYRSDKESAEVTIAYEVKNYPLKLGDKVTCVDFDGKEIGKFKITKIVEKQKSLTQLVTLKAPESIASKIVSLKIQSKKYKSESKNHHQKQKIADDAMVCLCEHVTAGEIRKLIKKGIKDMNQIKAITRAGMGSCGGKTCQNLIRRLFKEEGISLDEIVADTRRPLFVEVELDKFANGGKHE